MSKKQPKTTVPDLDGSASLLAYFDSMRKIQIQQALSANEQVKKLLGEDTAVVVDGETVYNLNAALVLKQGLDASELRHLKSLHREKLKYFKLMENTDSRTFLKDYAKEVECIEFEMQKTWHFDQDKNFHEWYKVPKCTCPKMDNADFRGTSRRVIVSDCPIHGDQ